MTEPRITVGIMYEPSIVFNLKGSYKINGGEVTGSQSVKIIENQVSWGDSLFDELHFEPVDSSSSSFELIDVTIGINFHWERKENQSFKGALKLIVENGKITAINEISVEEYLISVISSEMSATASLQLLKAHAVISRSWLLAQIQKNKDITESSSVYSTMTDTGDELIKWYDREDHTRFDICADDHCQRYQGITRASTEIVKQAVNETRGLLLMYAGRICDARYSKSCGGIFEEFGNCWEEIEHPYLVKKRDSASDNFIPDLTIEQEAENWILSSPEAFCNTTDVKVLSQVLNNYDQETVNFYRWCVQYGQKELSELIYKRSGVDYGNIIDLVPIQRGTSGRLVKMKIIGSKLTKTIGKELEIRRTLSQSHLYSSAFVVEKGDAVNGVPSSFKLKGAGWGHGVGLCQIGAAVMGEKGYKFDEILLHYFIGASIDKMY